MPHLSLLETHITPTWLALQCPLSKPFLPPLLSFLASSPPLPHTHTLETGASLYPLLLSALPEANFKTTTLTEPACALPALTHYGMRPSRLAAHSNFLAEPWQPAGFGTRLLAIYDPAEDGWQPAGLGIGSRQEDGGPSPGLKRTEQEDKSLVLKRSRQPKNLPCSVFKIIIIIGENYY